MLERLVYLQRDMHYKKINIVEGGGDLIDIYIFLEKNMWQQR